MAVHLSRGVVNYLGEQLPDQKRSEARFQGFIHDQLVRATKSMRARGVSLTRIAADAGTHEATLKNYMDEPLRKIPVHTAIRWARVVGVSPAGWLEEAERLDGR